MDHRLIKRLAVAGAILAGFCLTMGRQGLADSVNAMAVQFQNGGSFIGAGTILNCDNSTTTCSYSKGVATIAAVSGASGINQLAGDVTAGPGSGKQTATVVGIDSVPLCSGFSPSNTQFLQYTTGGSPNPCYTAAAGGSSGYTTIENIGTSLTSRSTLQYLNGLGCNDSGSLTQCTGFLGTPPPSVASSTWVNQATASATTTNGIINISDSANEEGLHMLCQAAPSTPYTITIQLRYLLGEVTSKYPYVAFGFSNGTSASTSKFEVLAISNNAGAGLTMGQYIGVDQWTNSTTYLNSTLLSALAMQGRISALQVSDDGTTNKTWQYSADGVIFTTAATEARTTFLTASEVCWGVRTNASATTQLTSNTLLSWVAH